jgi:plastocyanin
MGLKRRIFVFALMAVLASAGAGYPRESGIRKDFSEALEAEDRDKLYSIVRENEKKIPGEIRDILADASRAPMDEREALLYIAEVMATIFKDLSGDMEFFKVVKKKIFEAGLTAPVRSVPQGGVHIVAMPEATEKVKNIFKPDNIIINKGGTIRWVNNDTIAHLLGSMPFIGEGGLFSPYIEPGEGWEHTFAEPGEYYYICFIHRDMIGKVKVVKYVEESRRVNH